MNKLLLLIAGSNISEREVSRSLKEIFAMDQREIFEIVEDLRAQTYRVRSHIASQANHQLELANLSKSEESVLDQISQILRTDTGLTTTQASEILIQNLNKYLSMDQRDSLPALNKESFSSWLRRLARLVPASVLMHEAAKIRNMSAHTRATDWPLGEK